MRKLLTLALLGCAFCALAANDAAEKPELITPLLIGAQAPQATMIDIDGNEVTLSEKMGEKPSVVIFYRGSW